MDIIVAITGVWSKIITWLTSAIASIIPIFYDGSTGLTFMGVLAICGLGISVIFLLIGLIQNFLHFRG